jgi:hypothetical protein
MRAAVACLAVVGCGFDPAPAGIDGDPLPTPPDGPDAPMPGPDDADGDGILDIIDNCPNTVNSQQWNEDADPLGDVCDPCPHLGAPQADPDGDSIGDDCDPHPDTPGDTLVVFEGFHVAGSFPSLAVVAGSGTWGVSGGALRYQFVNDEGGFVYWQIAAGTHTVDTTATIHGVTSAGGATVTATVVTDLSGAPSQFVMCGLRYNTGEHDLWSFVYPTWYRHDGNGAGVVLDTPYRIVSRSEAGTQTCRVATTPLTTGVTFQGPNAGVRARNMVASFAYVAIYQ